MKKTALRAAVLLGASFAMLYAAGAPYVRFR
jgi:hypothetical protein